MDCFLIIWMKLEMRIGLNIGGCNTALAILAADTTFDPVAANCFLSYLSGKGGESKAWEPGYTRKNIPAAHWILKSSTINNSAGDNFNRNMNKAMRAAESVLNQYNTEVYLSVSPDKKMDGCFYVDVDETIDVSVVATALLNIPAFGTFNNADAGITLHCVYDPKTEEYTMDFKYCLIDYYDFPKLDVLNEQDMLGMVSGYELYGCLNDTCTWKKGEEKLFYNSWIEYLLERVNEKKE